MSNIRPSGRSCIKIYFALEFLDNWEKHLEDLNKRKVGRKFETPWQFVEVLIILHIMFCLSYRKIEYIIIRLSEFIPSIRPIKHTTVWKRSIKHDMNLTTPLSDIDHQMIIVVDSSGTEITDRADWITGKWKNSSGWIKVHIEVDIETNEIRGIEVKKK